MISNCSIKFYASVNNRRLVWVVTNAFQMRIFNSGWARNNKTVLSHEQRAFKIHKSRALPELLRPPSQCYYSQGPAALSHPTHVADSTERTGAGREKRNVSLTESSLQGQTRGWSVFFPLIDEQASGSKSFHTVNVG